MHLLLAFLLSLPFAPRAAPPDTVVVAVRHAEKAADDPKDPNLSEAGQARAVALARALADYPLTSALVSEYKRTLQTADPALKRHGVTAKVVAIQKDTADAYAQRLAELVKREHQ